MAQHDDQKDNKRKVDAEAQVGVGLKNKLPRRSQRQSASSACAKTEEESGVDVKPGVDTTAESFILKLECYKPANPNSATVAERSKPTRVNNGQRILTICYNDSLEGFLTRLGPKVQKDIGGIPADWMIQLKSSGSDSEYFKEFTLLEIDGESEEEEAHSQWL
ncbi:unnamed protein product [Tilletia laevis]|uniref:Uncharacterized protein n=1 Tax=Tilletia laevis TaxID=157183 RepID=A0A9N8M4T3_9BASI|nr:unnamed protein product [Tilletia laevis]